MSVSVSNISIFLIYDGDIFPVKVEWSWINMKWVLLDGCVVLIWKK